MARPILCLRAAILSHAGVEPGKVVRAEPISSTLCRSLDASSCLAACCRPLLVPRTLRAFSGGGKTVPPSLVSTGCGAVAPRGVAVTRMGDNRLLGLLGAGMASLRILLHCFPSSPVTTVLWLFAA